MEQTAVKWFANELLHLDHEFDMNLIDKNEYQARRKNLTKQAKEMEKEQIKDAYNYAYTKGWNDEKSEYPSEAEQYFNKTFKPE